MAIVSVGLIMIMWCRLMFFGGTLAYNFFAYVKAAVGVTGSGFLFIVELKRVKFRKDNYIRNDFYSKNNNEGSNL